MNNPAPAQIYSLVYVSSATRDLSAGQVGALLEKCRSNNMTIGISGMLLYKGGNFMQLLEGDQVIVRSLYSKIVKDPRHSGCIELLQSHQEARSFPRWSMAFRDLNQPEKQSAAYSDFLNLNLRDTEFFSNPTKAQQLLLSFRNTMR
jgi:hypothetical protein